MARRRLRRAGLVPLAAVAALTTGIGVAIAVDVTGTSGPDVLRGTSGADTISGWGGNDDIAGWSGNDTLRGNKGADLVKGNKGADSVNGDGGRDVVDGGDGADRVNGGSGPDEVIGGAGRDELFGGDGNDILRARDGEQDRIFCGNGNDTVYADTLDTFPTSELTRPRGTCENINWIKPWQLPVRVADLDLGAAALTRPHREYPAIDLSADNGDDIYAVRGGYVEAAGWNPLGQSWCGYGVVIRGVGGGQYIYCHMTDAPDVSEGMGIGTARKIGDMGSTGQSSGPHLHLQIWRNSMQADGFYNSVCPQPMLKAIYDGRSVPTPSQLPNTGCVR